MTTKRRFWQAILVALACWPFAHYALVSAYGLSPWKFHGMAMYCTPKLRESAVLHELVGRRSRPVLDPAPELEQEVNAYLRARSALGEFASTEGVEQAALEHMADRDGLLLEIHGWRIDSDSHRMRSRSSRLLLVNTRLPGADARRLRLEHDFLKD